MINMPSNQRRGSVQQTLTTPPVFEEFGFTLRIALWDSGESRDCGNLPELTDLVLA